MPNQNQSVEAVKLLTTFKSLNSLLFRNLIKAKLCSLVLLTLTTGGMTIATLTIPELLPPSQARGFPVKKIPIRGGKVNPKPIKVSVGESLQWFCKDGIYGVGAHKVEIIASDGSTMTRYVNYDGTLSKPLKLRRGTYQHIIDGKPAPDIIVE